MSRSVAAEKVASGELETFTLGGRRMVSVEKGREFAERAAKKGAGPIPPDVSAKKRAAGKKGRAVQLKAARDEELAR